MTSPRVFHAGPPPSLGWWPASSFRRAGQVCPEYQPLRFWDGFLWSSAAGINRTAEQVTERAREKLNRELSAKILWAPRPDSWPEASKT